MCCQTRCWAEHPTTCLASFICRSFDPTPFKSQWSGWSSWAASCWSQEPLSFPTRAKQNRVSGLKPCSLLTPDLTSLLRLFASVDKCFEVSLGTRLTSQLTRNLDDEENVKQACDKWVEESCILVETIGGNDPIREFPQYTKDEMTKKHFKVCLKCQSR